MMYAIIDIETTGGQFNQEGITEIAIYKFDGVNVVDQFISLVNPEIPIQPFVVKLTGINNAMLRSAPKFYEVAKRIVEITKDCIIVAHNAAFDYRILKMEFKRLGFEFNKQTLCTVELSKLLLPEAASYSLGKLVRSLGIPIADRHRAYGDSFATLKLFTLLLSKDKEKKIIKTLIKNEISQGVSPKLFDILEKLPLTVGIFYIHNSKGEIIYIGKSTSIRKKLTQLFTGTSKIAKRIQNEVYTVTFEETGNELIASLKEREEIVFNKPALNTSQRKSPFLWAVYAEKTKEGYISLKASKTDGRKKEIRAFKNQQSAVDYIKELSDLLELSYELNALIPKKNTSDYKSLDKNIYNQKIIAYIDQQQEEFKNLLITFKGRKTNEKSAIVIKDGDFQGYCFFDLNYQINTIDILNNILIRMTSSKEAVNIIKYYLYKKKDYKLIRF